MFHTLNGKKKLHIRTFLSPKGDENKKINKYLKKSLYLFAHIKKML